MSTAIPDRLVEIEAELLELAAPPTDALAGRSIGWAADHLRTAARRLASLADRPAPESGSNSERGG